MSLACKSDKRAKLSVFDLLSSTSTIHGVKYIGDYQSPRASRTFWICAFALSILGCVYYATQVYDKWYVTPDIGLKVFYKSSRSVPFPAITICPQTKIKSDFLNYSRVFNLVTTSERFNITEDEKKYLEMALQVCTLGNTALTMPSFHSSARLRGEDIVRLMGDVQFTVNETVIIAKVWNRYTDAFNVTNRVLTSEGFCVTFNMADHKDIFRQDADLSEDFESYKSGEDSEYDLYEGYRHNEANAFPIRIFAGARNTVTFIMAQNKHDIDEACRGPDQGFKVYWHMPHEIPGYWHRSVLVGGGKGRSLIMKATRTTTSKDLERYEVSQRRCYYEGERELQFFRNYTKSHCDLECLTNFVLGQCGCVRFFMPRNTTTPVCDITRLRCAEAAEVAWLENDEDYLRNSMPCKCFPGCATLSYSVLMNAGSHFDTNETLRKFEDDGEFFTDFPTGQMSRLVIQFEDFLIQDQENYLGYKMQHFISDCGGLLGLFMGCSILSLVELIYQTFAFMFFKPDMAIEDNSKRVPTPKNDKKAVVLHADADDVVVVDN